MKRATPPSSTPKAKRKPTQRPKDGEGAEARPITSHATGRGSYQWVDGPVLQLPDPPPSPPPAPPPRAATGPSLALAQQEGRDALLVTPQATAASYAAQVEGGMSMRESAFRLWWPDNPDLGKHIAIMRGVTHRMPEIFGVHLPSLPPPELRAAVVEQLNGPLYRQHFLVLVEAVLRGFVEVKGVYPRLSLGHQLLDNDTICEGRLDLARETMTDYRTDHTERYWSLRVRATQEGLRAYNSVVVTRPRGQIFTETIKAGDHLMDGNTIHILRSKRCVWGELSKAYPGLFSTFETFKTRYATGGSWAGDLRNPIVWGKDRQQKEDQ